MTLAAPSDPVGKQLLPVLLHEVNNTTQLLVGLRAILDIPGGETMFAQRSDDLARASDQMHDLGFAMAVVATSSGAGMLMARRHKRALQILFDLACHALERSGEDRVATSGEAPDLAPGALDGWQPPWSVAALVLEVARCTSASAWSWQWTEAGELHATPREGSVASLESLTREALDRIERGAPGLAIDTADGHVVWRAPSAWWLRTANG